MTRKNTEEAEAETRKNSRKGRSISHGMTRKNTEAAEAKTRKNAEAAAEELATE